MYGMTIMSLNTGGRSLAMMPESDHLFIVGSDEGEVYLCTTLYSSEVLLHYPAHSTPVQSISWNTYLTSVFLTCGTEKTVKIWSKDTNTHLFCFDLLSQVKYGQSSTDKEIQNPYFLEL